VTDTEQTPRPPQLFQKGKSGNPNGRPKGSKNAISLVKMQVEGDLRAQMKPRMQEVIAEIIRRAMPTERVDPKTGEITLVSGDGEMLKLLYKSWVSGTKASDDEAPKEKIQIVIGKLDQIPNVTGKTYSGS
jgi:hypothetical protein